jgi:hypothetical protein
VGGRASRLPIVNEGDFVLTCVYAAGQEKRKIAGEIGAIGRLLRPWPITAKNG